MLQPMHASTILKIGRQNLGFFLDGLIYFLLYSWKFPDLGDEPTEPKQEKERKFLCQISTFPFLY